jgi:uncharacterized protein
MVTQPAILDGNDLTAMFTAGTDWLEKVVPEINSLNVYPVPDGDCGTNMLLTMRASLGEIDKVADRSRASNIADAMAKGSLMGARGNSGVILSQIWRGMRDGLKEKTTVNAGHLANAFKRASEVAYQALTNPVEGTILTVMKDAAAAANAESSRHNASPLSVLQAAVNGARISVRNTPNLLPVLKEAGVMDAGGHGLFTILEGSMLHLMGETDHRTPEILSKTIPVSVQNAQVMYQEEAFGFCTQFMIKDHKLNIDLIRITLETMGRCLIVVGDSSSVRIHIHALEPQKVIEKAGIFGTVFDVDVRNMDEQHEEFVLINQEKTVNLHASVVAVVNGDGMLKVFSDLNVSAIVPGGQTMNPSTMDILQAVDRVPSDNVLVLPNNKNIIPTAKLVENLTKKTVKVIPTETIPQGIAAMISFIPENDMDANFQDMSEAIDTVRTIEITQSTRDSSVKNLKIKAGQVIGLLDGELLASGSTPEEVIFRIFEGIDLKDAELISVYFGKGVNQSDADKISSRIAALRPGIQTGTVSGGFPNYSYIISVE